MSLASLFSFCSCANAGGEAYSAHIQSFTYHYNGTIGGNSHSFAVQVSDQAARITVEELEHMDYGDVTDTVGMELVQALEELCAKHDVMKFNGFDKTNPHVCDGSGFSLSITYDNGKSVFARGMNSSPKGYRAFSDDLHELFKPYRDKLYAAALQKKIANGVKGDIRFMLMNFIQQGESGFDRYEVMISHAASRENNFQVKIRSVSGEFFPKGEYDYYCAVPDDAIDWKAFTKLVKKHQLVQWMDYEKTAADYNNCEWFQLEFIFDEYGQISAMGTEHPENYDAFRKDYLTLLRKTVDLAIKKYHITEN